MHATVLAIFNNLPPAETDAEIEGQIIALLRMACSLSIPCGLSLGDIIDRLDEAHLFLTNAMRLEGRLQ
ncbi:hypothetical protein SAMN06265221_11166 [Paracoccus laeviglucosivorans]|uniref:Uncharacterized protein n=2 Tax=Paracoccus laeviglucosivorans TaxID=1197861 RepID=A0A521E7K6_9RHOB|nr:hypothetical protein SAMN06265221_11166 [Paracoccus laeviglucosivorans]